MTVLFERQSRPAEAARERRFIVGRCQHHGDELGADWPTRELRRLKAELAAGCRCG